MAVFTKEYDTLSEDFKEDVKDFYDTHWNMSLKELARKFNISEQTAKMILLES